MGNNEYEDFVDEYRHRVAEWSETCSDAELIACAEASVKLLHAEENDGNWAMGALINVERALSCSTADDFLDQAILKFLAAAVLEFARDDPRISESVRNRCIDYCN